LRPHLVPHFAKDTDFEILIPGCGNSELGAHLYDEGFVNITNIDISAVVINFMTERYSDREEMEFTKMDATNMEFLPNDCFNLIVDKAVLDAQLCGEDNFNNVSMMINEMYRVLKPGGVYVCVSYGVPATRMGYLKTPNLDWTVTNSKLAKPRVEGFDDMGADTSHYIYSCVKPM
jgi:ubiquinone/menaquinone biosynthesis C-methylase UbiE